MESSFRLSSRQNDAAGRTGCLICARSAVSSVQETCSQSMTLPKTWQRRRSKLSCAICSVLGIQSGAVASASDAAGGNFEALSAIIVTAQRREEKLQNVPITIQALSAESIAELNVQNLDQFIKFLPNVTQSTNGPAQGDIVVRGLSVGGGEGQGSGSTSAFPSVAIYL